MFEEYQEIFAKTSEEMGDYAGVEHEIEMGDAKPVKQKSYRAAFKIREEQKRQIKNMVDQGVVRPSNSPWASPVVMVSKKDGTLRFCVDFQVDQSFDG